ncbi:TonB-linked SusC/RagA family outer membrane protein [Leeuwenhoekiella aestuarii]|uniref:SusC/RagA family TonB-linked outer membrane protein n=1 Tax=Leeuwenhoekiella aestuarii TaxID=2249426 RepID=UPI00102628F1|nr:SusC/RagA family TonB-linked outer membrane protein [Leeuwenhoekiella aestuarii]RXG14568.1 TonB-linked SusC/RagA family outer membrane protein [Leeuwenhoekiella aestuarii]
MKKRLQGFLMLFLVLVVQFSFAQTRTISGTVTDDSGVPLPGVNVLISGTTTGTQTDFDGLYSIEASTGDVLTFSYVGFTPQDAKIGASSTVNIQMQAGESLEEVVVTAQGIKREKKALGYAVSEVASEDLEQRPESDVARVLSGKASGVEITAQNGTSGSATNVVIRGYTSINGSNQALFVVDGVPFSSGTNSQDNFVNGNVGSSRFLDIDPNNIASITVLKGLAAATLYGTDGRNGVILITTKANSGQASKKKTEITLNQSFFFNEIASLPDYQQSYGGGFNQSFGWFFSNYGPNFSPNGVDGYLNDPAGIVDANGNVPHPYSTNSFLSNFLGGDNELFQSFQGVDYAYKPYASVKNFFRTGSVSNTSLNIRGGSDDGNMSFNVNFGHTDDEGFTPGNSLTRNTLSVGGRAKLSNRFTVTGILNYSRSNFVTPPVAASDGNANYGLSVFGQVFFTPISVDLMNLPFEIPETGGSIYYRNGNDIVNPRWIVANAQNGQLTNRVFGNAQLSYEFNDNVSVLYRGGIDIYNERNHSYSNKGGVNSDADRFGYYNTWDNNSTTFNHYAAISGNYDLTADQKLNVSFLLGGSSLGEYFDQQGVASSSQIVYNVQRHFNFENQLPIQSTVERNTIGLFGDLSFEYDSFLYLSLSGRNDWISNLIAENNSQFYPSVSASFIPTSAFEGFGNGNSIGLNYLKLRAGLGSSAGFPSGYPTVNTIGQSTQVGGGAIGGPSGIVTNTVSNSLANPQLLPELISEWEVGFDARLLKNRLDISLSYYDRTTKNLIVGRPLSPSSGYTGTSDNIGKVEGTGWEADLGIDIFKSSEAGGFNWNSRVNFTTNKQIVTEQASDQIVYAGFSDLGNAAIEGEQLGVIVGSRVLRDDNGNFVVGNDGFYVSETQIAIDANNNEVPVGTEGSRAIAPIIGNPNPDYVMNFINSISYKNLTLGFQISHVSGGDIYSQTIATLLGRGLINPDRREPFILPGVLADGTPNRKQLDNSSFYFDNVLFGPSELQIYDASVIRLKELSLSYNMPKKWLESTPFGNLSITAAGYNLWYDAYNTPERANFDPNVAGIGVGNGRGFDYLNGPSSIRYGLSVKATF